MNPVVVIGAGLAGLSAACYLAGRGYDVTVVKREEIPGGLAGMLHREGFTFDSGPTVLTMPDLIADAVRAAMGDPAVNLKELLSMSRLNPAYRVCFADGGTINVRYSRGSDAGRDRQELWQRGAAAFGSYVNWLRRLYLLEIRTSSTGIATPRSACCRRRAIQRPASAPPVQFQAMYAGLAPASALPSTP
jgi:phytoene desaturase